MSHAIGGFSKRLDIKGQTMKADLVIKNAKVVTVDEAFSIQEAIAVKDGRIQAVGSNTEVDSAIGPETQVIDLGGKTLLPGINDAHLHAPLFGASRPPVALDLSPPNVLSLDDMAEALRTKVAESQPGEWIRGFGWDPGAIAECKNDPSRLPRKWDIDAVSPDNPVVFNDFSAHNMLVNSRALAIAGIDKHTPAPQSGEMERDPESGEPTGIFQELGAQSMISRFVPLLTREEKKKALLTALELFNANGITSFTDAAIGPGGEQYVYGVMSTEFIDIYQELLREGRLTARATILLLFGDYGALTLEEVKNHMATFELPTNLDRNWLNLPGIKIFADGIPPTKTAWMKEEYVGGGRGSLVIPGETDQERTERLRELIGYIHSLGFQMGIHTTGDRAIETTVDGLLSAMTDKSNPDPRHYLIHGDFISREYAEQLARNNLGLSTQPLIKIVISDFTPALVGEERAAWEFPLRTMLDAGLKVSCSSDAPVTFPNWRLGVQAAVLRENLNSGKVSGPEQCISVEDAIRTYTINGAWQDHQEDFKGSIEPGKAADFCVLDRDILTVDPHEIGNIEVDMTIVDGRVVFQK
jgi:predicted amidohydrolase YtcJ